MVKMTFSLPEETALDLRRTAGRLGVAQSHVVRDAVAEYAARTDRLPERERLRMLEVLGRLRAEPPPRLPGTTAAEEIEKIRAVRRLAGERRSEIMTDS